MYCCNVCVEKNLIFPKIENATKKPTETGVWENKQLAIDPEVPSVARRKPAVVPQYLAVAPTKEPFRPPPYPKQQFHSLIFHRKILKPKPFISGNRTPSGPVNILGPPSRTASISS